MPHLTDSELEKISNLLATGRIGNAHKIARLLSREPTERVMEEPMKSVNKRPRSALQIRSRSIT
jgi:hypothetical protein